MTFNRTARGVLALCGMLLLCAVELRPMWAADADARDLFVTAGKSLVVESPVQIQRIAVGDAKVAEAVAVSPREVLVNGKLPGETSLIVWQQGGNRLLFDLQVRPSVTKLEAVREQLAKELPGQDVSLAVQDDTVFVRGTVADMTAGERVMTLAGTLGKPVNLLNVRVPTAEQQVLLKVRFANVDRNASLDLGVNLFSTGALNTIGSVTTQQFRPPQLDVQEGATRLTLSDALNIFLFRPDLNFGATIRALQAKRLLQILAEPNVLAINGRPASFLAGGEFPVPVVQSGIGGAGTVTIQWREFGIRINFTPFLTPRGTIRLRVAPEVSALDFANAVTISGFTVPALSTRRIQTEVELESGQSFAIAGLLDNRVIEDWRRIPGLASIPLIGKLFQSKAESKSNTELLVTVTPEVVRPMPQGMPLPSIAMPEPFLKDAPMEMPRTPGLAATGPVSGTPPTETIPYEQLQQLQQQMKDQPSTPQMPALQLIPIQAVQPGQAPAAAPAVPTAAPAPSR